MGKLRITLACGDYDRVAALKDGRVQPEGVNLTFVPLEPEELFFRMVRHHEFDVSELSLASYITSRAQGREDFIAIPVFPSRMFRHSALYVNSAAGIEKRLRGSGAETTTQRQTGRRYHPIQRVRQRARVNLVSRIRCFLQYSVRTLMEALDVPQ